MDILCIDFGILVLLYVDKFSIKHETFQNLINAIESLH